MSNNGVRILIERRDGNRFYWTLNAYGEELYGHRSEASLAKAAEVAESSLMQIDLAKHYRKQA